MTDTPLLSLKTHSLMSRRIHIGLLIIITSIVFSNTIDNAYHLDSVYRVGNNTEIDRFWPPARFFTDFRTGSTIPQIAELDIYLIQVTPRCSVRGGGGLSAKSGRIRAPIRDRGGVSGVSGTAPVVGGISVPAV